MQAIRQHFRKAIKESMMLPALAGRIILRLYILRNLCQGKTPSYYSLSTEYLHDLSLSKVVIIFVVGSALSYLFNIMGGRVSSYCQLSLFFPILAASTADWIESIEGGKGVKAAAYIRVSSGRQAREGFSLDAQKQEIEKLAQKEGISFLYGFVDAGKSGVDFDRRKLNLILELAEKREIGRILVVDIDRIGRDSRRLLTFFSELRDYDVTVITPEGELDVNRLEDMLLSAIKAWAAQHDNERRARAAVAGKQESFKQRHWNKPVPLGYRRSSAGYWIEKIPDWEAIIKDAFDLFLTHGNLQAVRTQINTEYKHLLSEPLTRDQVRRILSDTVYIGQPSHIGECVLDHSLSFVTEDKFGKVQEVLKQLAKRHNSKEPSPLRRLIQKYGISVLHFFDQQIELHHRQCGGLLVENGTRLDGTKQNFLCRACGIQLIIPTSSQLKKIQPTYELNTIEDKNDIPISTYYDPSSYNNSPHQQTPKKAKKNWRNEHPVQARIIGKIYPKINYTQTGLPDFLAKRDLLNLGMLPNPVIRLE